MRFEGAPQRPLAILVRGDHEREQIGHAQRDRESRGGFSEKVDEIRKKNR